MIHSISATSYLLNYSTGTCCLISSLCALKIAHLFSKHIEWQKQSNYNRSIKKISAYILLQTAALVSALYVPSASALFFIAATIASIVSVKFYFKRSFNKPFEKPSLTNGRNTHSSRNS